MTIFEMAVNVYNVLKNSRNVLQKASYAFTQLQLNTLGRQLRLSRAFHLSPLCNEALPIKMPSLSPTMEEGTIVKWYKKEGDALSPGDVICDIQTDKAVVSFEVEEEGTLAKIIKPENSKDVKIGTLIAVMVEEGEDWQNVEIPVAEESAPASAPASESPSPDKQEVSSTPPGDKSKQLGFGPAVRTLLDIYQIQAAKVTGSGPHGRILKSDVLNYIAKENIKPAALKAEKLPEKPGAGKMSDEPTIAEKKAAIQPPPTGQVQLGKGERYIDIELSNMRKTIAKRLTLSKTTIPHHYCTMECCIDNLVTMRKDMIADGVKVSLNDFIIKAVAIALKEHPQVNSMWTNDGPQLLEKIDICVAVATDNGLITPIVTDAIGRGVQDISNTVKDLATRARENKLKLEEFQGGSFTISNLGMFGISSFSAIINPPQACILAVGGSRTVLDPETFANKTYMSVTLCSDGRIVHDEQASKFVHTVKELLEEPMLMLSQKPKKGFLARLFAK